MLDLLRCAPRLSFARLVAFVLLGAPVRAAVTGSFAFTVARAPHPLALDPTLADPGVGGRQGTKRRRTWINVTTRSPATLATTAYLLYDDKNRLRGLQGGADRRSRRRRADDE